MGDVLTPAVRALRHSTVMAGLDPAIYAGRRKWCGVDARIKSAHDDGGAWGPRGMRRSDSDEITLAQHPCAAGVKA